MEGMVVICTGAAPGTVELRAKLARSSTVGKEKRPSGKRPERRDIIQLCKEHSYPVV